MKTGFRRLRPADLYGIFEPIDDQYSGVSKNTGHFTTLEMKCLVRAIDKAECDQSNHNFTDGPD